MRGKDRSDTMISNQILQDTIDGIKAITRIDLCVMDTEGKPLASTLDAVEEYKEAVLHNWLDDHQMLFRENQV